MPGENFWMHELPGVQRIDSSEDSGILHGLPENLVIKSGTLSVGDDIVFFGYPTSLASNFFEKSTPLLRSGIIAGLTDNEEIVVDCPVYYGNSGGLVMSLGLGQTFGGIGLASRMIPYVEETYSPRFDGPVAVRHENSGYTLVEPMDRVMELIDQLDPQPVLST